MHGVSSAAASILFSVSVHSQPVITDHSVKLKFFVHCCAAGCPTSHSVHAARDIMFLGCPSFCAYVLMRLRPVRGILTGLPSLSYIFYAGGSVNCRRRWPLPTTLGLTTLVAQCELGGR